MSIQAVAWVLDHSRSRGFARLVLISLANHADKDTGECWPSQRSIAQEAGISPGSIPSKVRELVELGEIVVLNPGDSRHSAQYQITFNQQPALDAPVDISRGHSDQRSGDERSARPMGDTQRSAGERSGDERSARAGLSAARGPGTEQNHHEPSEEMKEDPSPPTSPAMLPAETWSRRWAEVRQMTPTRSVLRSWVPQVQEFMSSGGEPSEELLAAAHDAGIESPAGWAWAVPKVTSRAERRRIADWIRS